MAKIERLVKTFYDSLEEGKIMARRCPECGHIEYPPYYACNSCGCLDTEWCELPGNAVCTQIIIPEGVMADPAFREKAGDYFVGDIQIENCDPVNSSIINVELDEYDELYSRLPLPVRPVIVQEDGYKNVYWEFIR